jgi:hypothetical protein
VTRYDGLNASRRLYFNWYDPGEVFITPGFTAKR